MLSSFMQPIQLHIHHYIQGFNTLPLNCIILPWLLVFSLLTGRNDDEIHAAVWKRDVGQEELMETKTWKIRRLGVTVCVWICAIHPVSPPIPIFSCCGLDPVSIPHDDLKEGTGMLLAFLQSFPTRYKVTDVTDWDRKDIALSAVLKIGLLKIKMLLHYKAVPDQQRAIIQPAELFFCFVLFCQKEVLFCQKYNCMLLQEGFDLSTNVCQICYGNFAIRTSILISCITVAVIFCTFVLTWLSLACWVCLMLVVKSLSKAYSRKSKKLEVEHFMGLFVGLSVYRF